MKMYQVGIIYDEKNAVKPIKGTRDSAGYDFTYKGDDIIINPSEIKLINLNVKLSLPKQTVLILKTRSSFAKLGVIVQGGVIDCDYHGDIIVCLMNLGGTTFIVKNNMRICQGILLNYLDMNFNKLDNFEEETERGEGGFGSTNK